MKTDFTESIERLQNSPLFALSLHGTELSHSNFWKWLIDFTYDYKGKKIHPFIEVFIDDFNENSYSFECVKREEGNRDLTIYYSYGTKRKCFIIENKIKSIPTKTQLDAYQTALEKAGQKKNNPEFVGGMLTGIIKTLDPGEPWKFKSYEDIADRIEAIGNDLFSGEANNTDWIVIKKYISDLRDETAILTKGLEDCKNQYIASATDYNLDKVKLDDIFLKIGASQFGKYIRDNINAQNNTFKTTNGLLPEVEVSFNNKKPTITIVYSEKCDKRSSKLGEYGRLGIQIEGKQYRIYGGLSSIHSDMSADTIFIKLENWFREYDSDKRHLDGKTSSMRGSKKENKSKYCLYSKENEYIHIYQYWDIDKFCLRASKGVWYDCLWEQIKKDLEKAKGIIDNGFSFKELTNNNNQ